MPISSRARAATPNEFSRRRSASWVTAGIQSSPLATLSAPQLGE
jgi:hypothetical protein